MKSALSQRPTCDFRRCAAPRALLPWVVSNPRPRGVGHSVARQNSLGLILVNLHRLPSVLEFVHSQNSEVYFGKPQVEQRNARPNGRQATTISLIAQLEAGQFLSRRPKRKA